MLNRLEMLRIFCAAAELGSFREAAIRLAISPQAVTRAVQELERLQGEVLFHRNTRQVQLSAYGAQLAMRAQLAVQQVDQLFEHGDAGSGQEPGGLVRVAAPTALAHAIVMPALTALAQRYPKIDFDVRLGDELVDVVSEKIDIGVRIGILRDNRFVVRRVAKMHLQVVGTPDCIARHGAPQAIADLDHLPTTAMHDRSTGRAWPWLFGDGQEVYPRGNRFICNDAQAELSAVLAGLAFGQLSSYLVDQHLAAGRLVALLQEHDPVPWDIYIYRPQRGPLAPRLRLVFDALAAALAQA